jgi:hypothetical protein
MSKTHGQKHHPTIGQKNHPSHTKLVKTTCPKKLEDYFYTCHFGVFLDKKT